MRVPSAVILLVLLFVVPRAACASPSFALEISVGPAREFAVGQSVQCQAYRPTVHRDHRRDPKPLKIALTWRVESKGAASIDAKGVLKALKPGAVTIRVSDGRKRAAGELPAGTEGMLRIEVRAKSDVPGGRLPRVVGLDGAQGFDLDWKRGDRNAPPTLHCGLSTKRWMIWFDASLPKAAVEGRVPPLPWVLSADKQERAFRFVRYIGILHKSLFASWRTNLTSATLTIESYKLGIAKGTLGYVSTKGIKGRVSWTAPVPDPGGRLAKAAARAKKAK